jgi:calcineurin-like phosphoesterase family protein
VTFTRTADLTQFRSRDASLWQSAVDEAVAKENAGSSPAADFGAPPGPTKRPPQDDVAVQVGNDVAAAIANQQPVPVAPPPSAAAGFADTTRFCATTAFRLAEAKVKAAFTHDDTDVKRLQDELGAQFNQCDAKWAFVITNYVASRVADKRIPYRRHTSLDDFVIADRLPDTGRVALLADWGTGQNGARRLLGQIAVKNPAVVIHLGDVYYSGTEHEVQNYFYAPWQKVLGIPKVAWGSKLTDTSARPATFHMTGNHDMYSGGQPYYTVIDMLGQPASYFCLRNAKWQIIALDTGLHDSNPLTEGDATFLEDTEVQWLKHQIATAGGRKTILLSHHQLYSAAETIGGSHTNQKLAAQVTDILPSVAAWFWGHEHRLMVYEKFAGVLGRCMGHAAFPVPVDDVSNFDPSVPHKSIDLARDAAGGLFQHGYVTLDLDGASAAVKYFQYNADTEEEVVLFEETL